MFPNSNKVDICEIDPASMSQRNKAGTTFLSSETPNISSQLRRYYAPPHPGWKWLAYEIPGAICAHRICNVTFSITSFHVIGCRPTLLNVLAFAGRFEQIWNWALIKMKKEKLTLGMLSLLQMASWRRRSRISQAKMDGHSRLNCEILPTTSLVATRGLEPPMALGRIEPVS